MKKISLISFVVLSSVAFQSMAENQSSCLHFYGAKAANPENTQIDAMVVKLKASIARTGKSVPEALIQLISTDPEFRKTRSQIPDFDKKLKLTLAKPTPAKTVVEANETAPEEKAKDTTVKPAPRWVPSHAGTSFHPTDVSHAFGLNNDRVSTFMKLPSGNLAMQKNGFYEGALVSTTVSYPGLSVIISLPNLHISHEPTILNDDLTAAAKAPFPRTSYQHMVPQFHFGGVGGITEKSGDSFFLRETYGAFTIVKAKDPKHQHEYHFSKLLEYTEREGIQRRYNPAANVEFPNGDFVTIYNAGSSTSHWDGQNFMELKPVVYGSFFSYWKLDPATGKYIEYFDQDRVPYTHSDQLDRDGINGGLVLKNESLVTYGNKGEVRIWARSGDRNLVRIGESNIKDQLVQKLGPEEITASTAIQLRNLVQLPDGRLAALAMNKYILLLSVKEDGYGIELQDIMTAPMLGGANYLSQRNLLVMNDGTLMTVVSYFLPDTKNTYAGDFDHIFHWKP